METNERNEGMTLKAHRDIHAPQLILVTNEHGLSGGVVYRWNETHKVGTRTARHAGEQPTMKAIRAAIESL